MTSFYGVSTVVSVWVVRQVLHVAQQTGRAMAGAMTMVVRESGDAMVRSVMAMEKRSLDMLDGAGRITMAVEEGTLDVVLEAQRCMILIVRVMAVGIAVGIVWATVWMLLRRSSSTWAGRLDAKTEFRLSGREPEANVDRRPGARNAAAVLDRAFESRSLSDVRPGPWTG